MTAEYKEETLALHLEAMSLWQFGKWENLAALPIDEIKSHPRAEELAAIRIAAMLHLQESKEDIERVLNTVKGTDQLTTKQIEILVAGVFNSLGRARASIQDHTKAESHFENSILLGPIGLNDQLAFQARKVEQYAQLGFYPHWFSKGRHKRNDRKLFVDGGGYDGCSAIKFKLEHPDFDIVSFEANPDLWHYYEKLPVDLIKSAVFDHNGEVEFTVDPVDSDGSSLIKGKQIDFKQKVRNEDCPVIKISCIDLSEFIREKAKEYAVIYLKLDVEGAEYAILKKMIADDTLKLVDKLYAEFHWHKIGMQFQVHIQLLEELDKATQFEHEEWDAQEFAVHKRDRDAVRRRQFFEKILGND